MRIETALRYFAGKNLSILVTFSGGGDSGDIDSIYIQTADHERIYFSTNGIAFTPAFTPEHAASLGIQKDLLKMNQALMTIRDYASGKAHSCGHDWWNNDGGQGSITIYPDTRRYDLNVGVNFTSTDNFSYNGLASNSNTEID